MPTTLNKPDLVDRIAEKAELSKKDAAAALDAFLEAVTEALKDGDKVQLTGFGSFESRTRKERKAKNLQTGATIIVPEGKVPAFKAGKALKDAVQ